LNYAQTLDYLFAKLPMFQRIGDKAFKKDLGNTIALLEGLHNPHLYSFLVFTLRAPMGKEVLRTLLLLYCKKRVTKWAATLRRIIKILEKESKSMANSLTNKALLIL
jgi:hypothetical protein